MSKWFAVKGPDGEIRCVDDFVYRAWGRAGWFGDDRVAEAKRLGYRCVEVRLVEVTDAPAAGGAGK